MQFKNYVTIVAVEERIDMGGNQRIGQESTECREVWKREGDSGGLPGGGES